MKLLLTSTGFSFNPKIEDIFLQEIGHNLSLPVAIITTASEGKEQNEFCQLARKQFLDMGFKKVNFFDVEKDDLRLLETYKVIYVSGGNTFYLLSWLKKTKADKILTKLVYSGVFYIGVSCGSAITGPTIAFVDALKLDPNAIGLKDFNALHWVDFETRPHYDGTDEEKITAHENTTRKRVMRIKNGESIFIKNGQEILINL